MQESAAVRRDNYSYIFLFFIVKGEQGRNKTPITSLLACIDCAKYLHSSQPTLYPGLAQSP